MTQSERRALAVLNICLLIVAGWLLTTALGWRVAFGMIALALFIKGSAPK